MIKSMYVDTASSEVIHNNIIVKWPMKTVILVSIIATIVLGIYPEPLVNQINEISNLFTP